MKKYSLKALGLLLALSTLTACGAGAAPSSSEASSAASSATSSAASSTASTEAPASSTASTDAAALTGEITVVSREPGSGTRTAFIELFGVEVKDDSGNKTDKTTEEAMIANKTDVMLTQVAGNKNAIGYVSLGSLNDSVKALNIDGATASSENVKNGSYKISRPFNIATKGEPTGLAKDFIAYILSAEGQEIVSDGYIKVNDAATPFAGEKPEGKLVIAGSSSVSPVMEKLREGYLALNPAATVEVQSSDSSAGMQALKEGTCDIGMASRALKDSETAELTGTQIALDGIAVVVNPENTFSDMTSDTVKGIYTGEITDWSQVK